MVCDFYKLYSQYVTMRAKPISNSFYFLLFVAGGLILVMNSIIERNGIPLPGEYQFSNFLRSNYSYISGSLFFLIGIIAGYYFKSNPWITGISLISIFPIIAIYEGIIYRGSHNLIPFEFVLHFLFSLPAVFGTYCGRFLIENHSNKAD